MKPLLAFTAVAEAATGAALLVAPSLVGRLLLGAELAGVAAVIARVTGIALVALGVACWPGANGAKKGMLTYSALVTVFLAWVGHSGGFSGPLLWPAVALHAVLTMLLARAA